MSGGTLPVEEALGPESTVDDLARLLGTSYKNIKYFYYVKNISSYYREFTIPKKSGGERVISAPNNQLGLLQSRLAHLLSKLYRPKDAAKAFIKGRSIVMNAKPHIRKAFVFNVDLKDFFPSITFPRIRGLLMSEQYRLSPEVSTVIAHLCVLDGKLPQGAPTSPVISNMICSRLDRELSVLASESGAVYTRYADDITFSFTCPLKYLPDEIVLVDKQLENAYSALPGKRLTDVISSNGFSINSKKTRLQSKNERQVVTGLKVNKKPNVDRRFVRKTSAIIHSLEINGLDFSENRFSQMMGMRGSLISHLRGRIQFIGQVKGKGSPVYQGLAVRFNGVSGHSRLPVLSRGVGDLVFSKFANARCWVIEGDNSQATGFMLSNNRLLTCCHFFTKEYGSFDRGVTCTVYRVNHRTPLSAALVYFDIQKDLAILDILHTEDRFEFFHLAEIGRNPRQGEKVNVLGFPDFKSGASAVNRFWTVVTNVFPFLGVFYAQIDRDIDGGNSGGPVLNDFQEVVGVAARGKSTDDGEIIGWNGFVMLSELHSFLNGRDLQEVPALGVVLEPELE